MLGRCLARELAEFGEVRIAGHSAGGDIRLNVESQTSWREATGGGITHVINCAGVRSPEDCLRDPSWAYMVNSLAVEYAARAADEMEAFLLHVSTDYVFPGDKPPYKEEDKPDPVNLYGRTKLAGEYAARTARRHLVARIPALWRADPTDPRSPTHGFIEKLRAGRSFQVENALVRHYSTADDIAAAIRFCIMSDMEGIINLSADETQTKAEFVRALAKKHGFDPGLIVNGGQPKGEDRRPHDSSLDTTRYRLAGGPRIRGVSEVLA